MLGSTEIAVIAISALGGIVCLVTTVLAFRSYGKKEQEISKALQLAAKQRSDQPVLFDPSAYEGIYKFFNTAYGNRESWRQLAASNPFDISAYKPFTVGSKPRGFDFYTSDEDISQARDSLQDAMYHLMNLELKTMKPEKLLVENMRSMLQSGDPDFSQRAQEALKKLYPEGTSYHGAMLFGSEEKDDATSENKPQKK